MGEFTRSFDESKFNSAVQATQKYNTHKREKTTKVMWLIMTVLLVCSVSASETFLSAEEKAELVILLNNRRSVASKGREWTKGDKRNPTAAYMAQLKWSTTLEKVADEFVKQCKAVHHSEFECGQSLGGQKSVDLDGYKSGEECSEPFGTDALSHPPLKAKAGREEGIVSRIWVAKEKYEWNYGDAMTEKNRDYMYMINGDSKYVGCATTVCGGVDNFACVMWPALKKGQQPYRKGATCSGCTKGQCISEKDPNRWVHSALKSRPYPIFSYDSAGLCKGPDVAAAVPVAKTTAAKPGAMCAASEVPWCKASNAGDKFCTMLQVCMGSQGECKGGKSFPCKCSDGSDKCHLDGSSSKSRFCKRVAPCSKKPGKWCTATEYPWSKSHQDPCTGSKGECK